MNDRIRVSADFLGRGKFVGISNLASPEYEARDAIEIIMEYVPDRILVGTSYELSIVPNREYYAERDPIFSSEIKCASINKDGPACTFHVYFKDSMGSEVLHLIMKRQPQFEVGDLYCIQIIAIASSI